MRTLIPWFKLPVAPRSLASAIRWMVVRRRADGGCLYALWIAFLAFLCLSAVPLPSHAQTEAPEAAIQPLKKVALTIGQATLNAEVAATGPQRERGLMFRSKLGDNDGMIFLMPTVTTATFWMKNTLIPLSIAFIDKNGVILDIHDMKALDESIVRSDNDQVAFALETNLHWFALNGIKPGDKINPPPATLGKPTDP